MDNKLDSRQWYFQLVDASHDLDAAIADLRRLANDPDNPTLAESLKRVLDNMANANQFGTTELDRLIDDFSMAYED